MDKGKDVVIQIDMKETGQVVINTEEEHIPTEIAQKILDEVLAKFIKLNDCSYSYLKKERKRWMFIAFTEVGIILLLLLKLKGVI